VYDIGEERILRLLHKGSNSVEFANHVEFNQRIDGACNNLSFRIPKIIATIEVDGRFGTIEERFPGIPLDQAIANADAGAQQSMTQEWLNAANEITNIQLEENQFGDIYGKVVTPRLSYYEYWAQRLRANLASRGSVYRHVDAMAIACGMPEPEVAQFVHLDLFSGNMLWHDNKISAVLDFGYATMMGDGRLNALFAAVFATTVTTNSSYDHLKGVHEWLRLHNLDEYFDAAQLMVAAYWSFVDDVEPLDQWCKSVLLH